VDRHRDLDPLAALERGHRRAQQPLVEHALELARERLALAVADRVRHVGPVEELREVESGLLPVVLRLADVEHLDVPDHVVNAAEAELRHPLACFLGDPEQVLHNAVRCTREALAQHRVLGRDADRTRVQVTHAHQDAAERHERRSREAELVRAQQRGDHDVPTGLQPAVRLHADPAAQVVQHQCLLRLGEADLPGDPACLIDACGDAPVPRPCR
jgi:hypothetical protein